MKVTALHIYPVKSMRGYAVQAAKVTHQGLAGDRQWMVADENGRFRSARECPQMLLWRPQVSATGLDLVAPDGQTHSANAANYQERCDVSVWNDHFHAWAGPSETDAWLSEKMGLPCRLIYLGAQSSRPLAQTNEGYSFADGGPYLITTQASLDALNAQLAVPVTMEHFRPNIVVDGIAAFGEDNWNLIRVGALEWTGYKPCRRCPITTMDPETGEKSPEQEPLQTLTRIHAMQGPGAYFGVNFFAHSEGMVHVGDAVQLL